MPGGTGSQKGSGSIESDPIDSMPKNLQVDEVVRIGQGTLSAVASADGAKQEAVGKAHG